MGCSAMAFLLASLGLFFAGGCAALASGRGQNASRVGAVSAIAASVIGLVPAVTLLLESLRLHAVSPLALTLGKLPMG